LKDLIHRAQAFATKAHQRINHQRKYTQAPYVDHLAATAKLVASVTSDPETIAAAWLHDTVEDTAVTIQDVQAEFGEHIAELVLELTDISTPSDGNRSSRKTIDLKHLASASPRAKTVKLADLTNNCIDITKHDARFSITYLSEMAALLDVLKGGNTELYALAQKTHTRCAVKLGLKGVLPAADLIG
jgi:(p)ppGpp synthase/HD superfamily hydrolase